MRQAGSKSSEQGVGRWQKLVSVLLAVVLALWMTACGGGGAGPADAVIEQGIRVQFEQTQQELRHQLSATDLTADSVRITGVKVTRTQRITMQGNPAYRIEGTYLLRGKYLSPHLRQTRNPFEMYLQSQDGGQSWSLMKPAVLSADAFDGSSAEESSAGGSSQAWQPIPLS